jgi:predicted NBD/HSP70 family sugar kinase
MSTNQKEAFDVFARGSKRTWKASEIWKKLANELHALVATIHVFEVERIVIVGRLAASRFGR